MVHDTVTTLSARVRWHRLPRYRLLVKALVLQLRRRDPLEYSEMTLRVTCSALADPRLLSCVLARTLAANGPATRSSASVHGLPSRHMSC